MREQMPTHISPFRHTMKYGLAMGVVIFLLFVCMTVPHVITTIAAPLLMGAVVWLTYRFAKHFRDTECSGTISYYQAFSYILILFFFASLVTGVLRYGYLDFINTSYLTESFNQTMLVLEQMQVEMPTEVTEEMRRLMTPTRFTMQFIMVDCMAGLFLALIIAAFVRKKTVINEENTAF